MPAFQSTYLRYKSGVVNSFSCFLGLLRSSFEEIEDLFQFGAQNVDEMCVGGRGRGFFSRLGAQVFFCTLDSEAFFMEEVFDGENEGYVGTAIESLSGAGAFGLDAGELSLPETQHVGGDAGEVGHFTDAEIEFVRYVAVQHGWV